MTNWPTNQPTDVHGGRYREVTLPIIIDKKVNRPLQLQSFHLLGALYREAKFPLGLAVASSNIISMHFFLKLIIRNVTDDRNFSANGLQDSLNLFFFYLSNTI